VGSGARELLWTKDTASEDAEDSVLYQGTTLVVPQLLETMMGFSP
jgi:hypothetical protein